MGGPPGSPRSARRSRPEVVGFVLERRTPITTLPESARSFTSFRPTVPPTDSPHGTCLHGGDYTRFEGGTSHTVSTDGGCLLLVRSSLHDRLVEASPA